MRLGDYVQVIRKRWWLIGLVGLTAAIAAYGFSKLQRPTYRAQARYVATVNRIDSGANYTIDDTLNRYISLVYNRDTMEGISQALQLDVSGDTLLSNVRLQPNKGVITIEADSPTTEDPPRIITQVGSALIAAVAEKNRLATGEDRIDIASQRPGQVFQAKPQTRINTLAGGLLGLILGTLLAFILEYLDDTLKTASDVERFSGLTTLGQIPSGAAQPASRRPRIRPATATGIIAKGDRYGDRQ